MFLEEIAALKDRYLERLQVFHFLEEEEEEVELFNGRLDSAKVGEVLDRLIDASQVDAFFICGPGPMMTAIENGLKGHNVPAEKILVERFTADGMPAPALASQPLVKEAQGRVVQLTLDGRKRTITFDASKESILENARAAGLPAPYACKAGVCATCRAKLVSGEVKMKQNYGLSPEEVAQGYVLTCQAVPVSDKVVLDYDG
jgi:ring-1,2-phenylacetyl-CoA epoxidase subunit PaaE